MSKRIDTTGVQKAFKKAGADPALVLLALAVFKFPLNSGLKSRLEAGNWPENSPAWKKRKAAKGWGQRPWHRTGKTLESISNNAPAKLGTSKGIKSGLNKKSGLAFASPRAFTDSAGRRKLSAKMQDKVYHSLQSGSAMARIGKYAEKKQRSLRDVLSQAFGPKKGNKNVPARPLFRWQSSWNDHVKKDVEKALKQILSKEGLQVK